MNKYTKNILDAVYKPLVQKYLLSPRFYKYKDIELEIAPGVFHPGIFYSTKYLLEYLESQTIKNKKILELGCGSGLISIYAAKKGAEVFASDISKEAVFCALQNSIRNNTDISIYQSDLFSGISKQIFNYIIINPPFYAKDPKSESEYAWYCGTNFEFFDQLFNSLTDYVDENSKAVMVLSEECNIERINHLAELNKIKLLEISRRKFLLETQFLFHLVPNNN